MAHPLSLLALTLALLIGFALLALSQDRNWRLSTAAPPPSQLGVVLIRTAGYGLLVIALTLAVLRDGPGLGSLLWVGLLPIAAGAVAALLSWRPRWLAPLVRAVHLFHDEEDHR